MSRTTVVTRVLAAILVVVVVGAVVVGAVVWSIIGRSEPTVSGAATLPGLTSNVSVVRNKLGVPDIYADSSQDLFWPRATSRPRTGSSRWTSAGTSPPGGSPSWSARPAWTPTR